MKKVLFLIVLTMIVTVLAIGQEKSKSIDNQNAKVEQTIRKMEQELSDDLVKGSAVSFERYLADSFIFVSDEGTVVNRADYMAILKAGDLKYESSKMDQLKIRVYGNTALMIFRTTDKAAYKNDDISGQFRWTDVLVMEGDNWKIVSSQGTKIP